MNWRSLSIGKALRVGMSESDSGVQRFFGISRCAFAFVWSGNPYLPSVLTRALQPDRNVIRLWDVIVLCPEVSVHSCVLLNIWAGM